MRFPYVVLLSACALLSALPLVAQSPNGVINGLVVDPSNRVVVGAAVVVANDDTGLKYTTKTNDEGIYVLPNLPPGPYRLQVSKIGFKTTIKPDIVLNVQDALSINFTLPIGAFYEIVTVEGGAPLINTESAAVSTVVDRQFAENLPMNGRSFQTLIQLTPGVVLTPSNASDSGQFSIDGQRSASNYWMVDGVSANIGVSSTSFAGNGFGGALPSFSVLGGTNSLVSVDAMQEFRIQTSTYAPEFGRTPGGQISIVTRSGTNQYHATAFDYLRNDIFDASNWFNGYNNNPPLPKAEERQNDFGGTFSGPILKDRTFFFFSYEGLRLRLPQTTLTTVPDLNARQTAIPAVQPYLSAFPFDPTQPDLGNGVAQFNASYSDAATLDAYSIRVDHKQSGKVAFFGRYNYSPSELFQRGNGYALSVLSPSQITTQTATLGASVMVSTAMTNDMRFNLSRTNAASSWSMDTFGGAVPLASLPLPGPFDATNGNFSLSVISLLNGALIQGKGAHNLQRQINLVDNLYFQKGPHTLKFGVDYRRLSPVFDPTGYSQSVFFNNPTTFGTGDAFFDQIQSARNSTLLFHNLGVFAQDTWRVTPHLILTYGLRWDVDFAPSSANGPGLLAVTGYDINDLSGLAIAPPGTPPFKTSYGNIAPRIGAAYQLSQSSSWQTVLRGGFGVFYDLATSEVGSFLSTSYPFGATSITFPGGTFPLSPAVAAPPPITIASLASGTLFAFDSHLKLPYALEWNLALEQGLGQSQALSVSYVGSTGKRLIQSAYVVLPAFPSADLVGNTANSDYNALQLQFQRRLLHNLQALFSYGWSHSIDDGSAGSALGNPANSLVPSVDPQANRGSSDFDIRNALSGAVTYDIPAPKGGSLAHAMLAGWSLQSVVQARSAPPVNVYDSLVGFGYLANAFTQVRPDVVSAEPFYLYGHQYGGGKALNPTAFTPPPTDPTTGAPLRQGDLPRNALRGFGAAQWDFAVHREFPIHEALKLQFRAEMFNLLNHPNFGPPVADLSKSNFGLSTQMLGQSLNNLNLGGGGLDPLYQIGGPRSIQFALKFIF